MKDFRTELIMTPALHTIALNSKVLTQGSCFADAIGTRLKTFKVNTMVNPFGVIYNPESIHRALTCGLFNEPLPEHTFVQNQELYLNYNFHSSFSSLDKGELLAMLTNTIGLVHYFLKDADWLILTYGTAWVYQREDTGEVVANCHKFPRDRFSRSLLTASEIVSSFGTFYEQVKIFNPRIRVMLTVSPVRHLKDTHELNQVSKSVLRVACHDITSKFEDAEYFPAYELMMDDLRDYRFYKSDMLHPTTEAEDYIWEKFAERYFAPELKDFLEKWKAVLSAIRHKPFHPSATAHQQFLRDTLKKLERLKDVVDVREEMEWVRGQIVGQ